MAGPSGSSSGEPWSASCRDRGLRVVAYDLRGHGASAPAVGGDYSLERFGEDLEAVIRAAVAEGELATVAGHSLGAMAIAAWAERHEVGARVRAAALINTGLGDLLAEHLLLGPAGRVNPRLSRAVMSSQGPVARFSTPVQTSVIRYIAFGPDAPPGVVAFLERMVIDCPTDVRAACGAALCDMDLWDALPAITVPALVIAGERDRLTPPSHARRIAAGLPQSAGLVELAGCGHMSPLERPSQVAEAIAALSSGAAPASKPRKPRATRARTAEPTADGEAGRR